MWFKTERQLTVCPIVKIDENLYTPRLNSVPHSQDCGHTSPAIRPSGGAAHVSVGDFSSNVLFISSQDLATLVNDQSSMVDDISDHIGRTAARTQQGHEQLVRAERSQRSARKRQCIVFVIAAFALAVLLLVITT